MKQGKHAKGNTTKMNRKVFALIASGALCCALATAGTLAYFSAEEKAHNVITSGGVDIKLNEWADLNKTQPFENVDGVMPGQTIVKVVEVENTGDAPAWVRVNATKTVQLDGGAQGSANVASLNFNTDFWTQGEDGWWYYNHILATGLTTEPLFSEVAFDGPGMDNTYQGAETNIDVYVQAVQSDNNSNSALTASGWPATK